MSKTLNNVVIKFVPSGRGKAQCPTDPDYPNGKSIDLIQDSEIAYCVIDLPYPAPECGHYRVTCILCGLCFAITAAGRADDPIRIKVPCKLGIAEGQA